MTSHSRFGRAHGGQVRPQKGTTGKYRFNLVATNGQVIATSEAYETKASALKGIESVKRNARPLSGDDPGDDRPRVRAAVAAARAMGEALQ